MGAAAKYRAQLRGDLVHVDAVLRLDRADAAEPGAGDAAVPPPASAVAMLVQERPLPRCMLAALRRAGAEGLTAVEIAARIVAAKGMDRRTMPSAGRW